MTDTPIFPSLLELADTALFLLRVWIAILFGWSGWLHVTKPRERGSTIGMPPAATAILGAVELVGAALLVAGRWTQLGATLLILVMVGAIAKKALVWKTGFWGKESSQGWYYEVLYLVCLLVIVGTDGGTIGV